MKDNIYRNAVDQLRFSDDLAERVRFAATKERKKHPRLAVTIMAAAVSMLLLTTAFAAGSWLERDARVKEIGSLDGDVSDAEILEFTLSESNEGVTVHHMELGPKGFYTFRDGLLYSKTEGFFRVADDYTLEHMDSNNISVTFDKNGREYVFDVEYLTVPGGIYTDGLLFYPEVDGEILVRAAAAGSHLWPVYLNLETGAVRDALPGFTDDDFTGRVTYAEPFRDGILISSLVEHDVNGNSRDESYHYWIAEGGTEAISLDLPSGWDYITGDTMYYKTRAGRYFRLDDNFALQELADIPKTTDDPTEGLLTAQSRNGTLCIADLNNGIIYNIPGLDLDNASFQETEGWNATRNSPEGIILLTNAVMDWEAGGRRLMTLAVLDTRLGVLKLLEVDSALTIQSSGWLDDHRYSVIYEDGIRHYLCVYEFTE